MGWLTHLFPSIPNYILQVSQASPPNANGQNPTPNPAHERIDDFRILPYGRFQAEAGFLGVTGFAGFRGGVGMSWSRGYGYILHGIELTGYYAAIAGYGTGPCGTYCISPTPFINPASMFGVGARYTVSGSERWGGIGGLSLGYFYASSDVLEKPVLQAIALGVNAGIQAAGVTVGEIGLNLGFNFATGSVVFGLNVSSGFLINPVVFIANARNNERRLRVESAVTQTRILFRLRGAQAGGSQLEALAENLRTHPHIRRIRIIGYAADAASISQNLHLSEQRANAVRDYLIDHGISPTRLEAVGRGHPADAPEGRSTRPQDRRVEFEVVEVE